MSRKVLWLLLLIGVSAHASDGEIGWTSLSFCNGAGYCVDIASSKGVGIDSLKIERNGQEITLPSDVTNGVQIPVLNQVRLVNVGRSDGIGENRLEIPFLTPRPDGGPDRSVFYLVIVDDKLSKTSIEHVEEKSGKADAQSNSEAEDAHKTDSP